MLNPDYLGSFVKSMIERNTSCDVSRKMLDEHGISLNSVEYNEWLNKYGLRMLKPTSKFVSFILQH
jgi:hypothetical protein